MSTTIKRVALVAVAALSLGVISVAPSQATINVDSLTLSAASAAQTTAETATASSAVATLSFLGATGDSASVTAALVSAPAGAVALPYLSLSETASAFTNGSAQAVGTITNPNTAVVVNARSGSAITSAKFKVFVGTDSITAPTVVGTYVVKLTPASVGSSGALLGATAQTLTITVTAAPALDTVAASATSILNAGETNSATADVTVTASKAIPASNPTTTSVATIKVSLLNAAGSAVTAESYTATISGPGTLGSGLQGQADNNATSVGRAITVRNGDVVGVFADGTAGVSTVTISSAAGKVLATETLTFFGEAAKIVTTVKKATLVGSTSGIADVLSVVVTDASGVNVSNLSTVNIVSSDTTKIAGAYTSAAATYSTTTGAYLVPLTSLAAGTASITVTTKSSATATTGVSADPVSVRVGSSTPASVSVSTDKSSYAPGEKAVISVVLKDKDGLVLADGDYTSIFATGGIVGSYTINGDTTTATSVLGFASGTKDYTVYMPVTEGDVSFAWTTGTGLATANQAVKGSVTVAVSSTATSAAIDAAQEASAAAQDATDAAISATEAAEEASALAQEAVTAVATLSAQVSKLITALKAQITTLTNLVIKIQKKVKA